MERLRATPAKAKSPGTRGVSWRERETLALLSIWGEARVQERLELCHRNIDVFQKIAAQMQGLGHRRTATECRTKTKALRQEYRRAVAHNGRPGSSPVSCQFYKQLDRILREEAGGRPRRVARSLKVRGGPSAAAMNTEPVELFSRPLPTVGGGDGGGSAPAGCGPTSDQCERQTFTESRQARNGVSAAHHTPEDTDETRLSTLDADEAVQRPRRDAAERLEEDAGLATPTMEQQAANIDRGCMIPAAEASPETRLARSRNRLRRVAMLNEVAEKMLEQGRMDQAEATRINECWMMQEEQRHHHLLNKMVEEGERDRQVFQETMSQAMSVMMAAVDALKMIAQCGQDRANSQERMDECAHPTAKS